MCIFKDLNFLYRDIKGSLFWWNGNLEWIDICFNQFCFFVLLPNVEWFLLFMFHILHPFHTTFIAVLGLEMFIIYVILYRNDADFLTAEWFMECVLKMEKQPMFHVTWRHLALNKKSILEEQNLWRLARKKCHPLQGCRLLVATWILEVISLFFFLFYCGVKQWSTSYSEIRKFMHCVSSKWCYSGLFDCLYVPLALFTMDSLTNASSIQ